MNPFQRGNRRREAFSGLVRTHGTVMVTLARRLVGASEAEDVVQAALVSAWKHFGLPEAPSNPRGWLLRFVAHECGNVIGRRLRRPTAVGIEDLEEEQSWTEDIVTTLQKELAHSSPRDPRLLLDYLDEGLSRALHALAEDERATLILRSVGELSYKEISAAMGVPIGTVMSRLCRAREKVRVELGRRGDGPPPRDATDRESQGASGAFPRGGESQ